MINLSYSGIAYGNGFWVSISKECYNCVTDNVRLLRNCDAIV